MCQKRPQLLLIVESGGKIRPPPGTRTKVTIARSMSSAVSTLLGTSSIASAALLQQSFGNTTRMCEDHVGLQGDQLFRERLMLICIAGCRANVDAYITAV
jgi:hypothetical protein